MDDDGLTLRTYQSLVNGLSDAMSARQRPSVKTWPLEVSDRGWMHDAPVIRRIRDGLSDAAPRRVVRVDPFTDTPALFRAAIGETLELFVDATERRMWQIHSMSPSSDVETVLDRWVGSGAGLSYPALPEQLLESASKTGKFVGFGLQHSMQFLFEDPDSGDSLTVKVQGRQAPRALDQLRGTGAFTSGALSSVKVHQPFIGLGAMVAGTVTVGLGANGRVTSRGDSFDKHRLFVESCLLRYRSMVRHIEDHALGGVGPDGQGLRPPLELRFDEPIEDLDTYIERALSGGEPFRLWGFAEKRPHGVIVAHCLDREANARFTLEAQPKLWRIYLPPGTPGSVVMRLWSRLQAHHDRHVRLEPSGPDDQSWSGHSNAI